MVVLKGVSLSLSDFINTVTPHIYKHQLYQFLIFSKILRSYYKLVVDLHYLLLRLCFVFHVLYWHRPFDFLEPTEWDPSDIGQTYCRMETSQLAFHFLSISCLSIQIRHNERWRFDSTHLSQWRPPRCVISVKSRKAELDMKLTEETQGSLTMIKQIIDLNPAADVENVSWIDTLAVWRFPFLHHILLCYKN